MRGKGPTPHLEPSPEAEEIQRFQPATRVLPETCSFRSPRCTQKWGELDWSFWACLLLLSLSFLTNASHSSLPVSCAGHLLVELPILKRWAFSAEGCDDTML